MHEALRKKRQSHAPWQATFCHGLNPHHLRPISSCQRIALRRFADPPQIGTPHAGGLEGRGHGVAMFFLAGSVELGVLLFVSGLWGGFDRRGATRRETLGGRARGPRAGGPPGRHAVVYGLAPAIEGQAFAVDGALWRGTASQRTNRRLL